MIVKRINADAKVAIPEEVLDALGLKPGDSLAYRIEGGQVFVINPEDDDEDGEDDPQHDAEIQAAIDEIVNDPHPRPTFSADEVFARVYAHIDSLRDRDAA